MSTIIPFINAMGETAAILRRELGVRDAATGWPAVTFTADGDFFCVDFECGDFDCSECVKAMIRETSTTIRDTPQGRIYEQRARVYLGDEVEMRDRVVLNGLFWEVEDVQFVHNLLSNLGYYDCTLIRLDI